MTETPQYEGFIGTVPVADKYEKVTYDGRTVEKGDIVAFDDRDIDHRDHDRGVHSRLFIGKVESIGDMERENWDEPQLFTTCPLGRLELSDCEVSGEGSIPDDQSGTAKFIEQFLSSDYEKYMVVEWGEDIDGSGEDFNRKGE